MPPFDSTPAVAYAAATPLPDPSHLSNPSQPSPERAARLQRMDAVLARLESMLDEFTLRLKSQVLPPELFLDRFERSTQALWRLTAVHKSLEALTANPLAPIPASLATEVGQIRSDIRSADVSSASPAPTLVHASPSDISITPQSTINNPQSVDSSQISNLKSQIPSPSPNQQSTINNLQSSSVPSVPAVPAVPACPTLSLQTADVYLNRTAADIIPPNDVILPKDIFTTDNTALTENFVPTENRPYPLISHTEHPDRRALCPNSKALGQCSLCAQEYCPKRRLACTLLMGCHGDCHACQMKYSCRWRIPIRRLRSPT